MLKKSIYIPVILMFLSSCRISDEHIIQFTNMHLDSYYYVDKTTKTLQCYGANANIITCYDLIGKEKLWEFPSDKLAYDRLRTVNYMYNSFDGNILMSLSYRELEEKNSNICIVNVFSGKVLKKLGITGYVYYTIKEGNSLYAVIGVNDVGIDRNGISDDVLIIRIDLLSLKWSIIFKLSDTGQSMKYKSEYLNIHLPLVIIDDMILFYTHYPYCAYNKHYLYSINKNNGDIYWKKNVLSNFAVDKINCFVYFVND
ncbi:hypothetical protein, partial [Treponema pedis]